MGFSIFVSIITRSWASSLCRSVRTRSGRGKLSASVC